MNTIKIKADTKEKALEIWTKKVKAKWNTLKTSQKNGTNAFIYKWSDNTLVGSLKPHHNAGTSAFYTSLAQLFSANDGSYDSTSGDWAITLTAAGSSMNSVTTSSFGQATISGTSGGTIYSSSYSATANSDNLTIQAQFETTSSISGTISNIAIGWYGNNPSTGSYQYNPLSNITTSTSIGTTQSFGVTIVYTNQG